MTEGKKDLTLVGQATRRNFTPDQVDLIKRTIAKGASDDELKLFLYQCERTGLDPFIRQIYFTKRKTKNRQTNQWEDTATIQTSIDGFRLIAERTGEYDGQSEPMWCGQDGVWKDVWLESGPPKAAKIVVFRKGTTRGFVGIAKWEEYVQTNFDGEAIAMWRKMPANQLAKCAEALGFRKGFPQDLSGIYTAEEMAQADSEIIDGESIAVSVSPIEKLSEETKATLNKAFEMLQLTPGMQVAKCNEFIANHKSPEEGAEQLLVWCREEYKKRRDAKALAAPTAPQPPAGQVPVGGAHWETAVAPVHPKGGDSGGAVPVSEIPFAGRSSASDQLF